MEEAGREQENNSLYQGVGEGARQKEKQRQQIREAKFILVLFSDKSQHVQMINVKFYLQKCIKSQKCYKSQNLMKQTGSNRRK